MSTQQPMQVLLVDDQAVSVQVHAASVRKTFSGAKVHTAVDLPEALQIASGHALDLVLLDLGLPTCTGIDARQRFRGSFPAVPVLVLSATEDAERIRACLEAGARGYILKTSAVRIGAKNCVALAWNSGSATERSTALTRRSRISEGRPFGATRPRSDDISMS
jgi:DNA-binding NarL/FixJ family response regulator